DFGLVAMVTVIITFSSVFINIGLGAALIQKAEVDDKDYSSVFFLNVGMGAFLTIILFVSAESIAQFYSEQKLTAITKVASFNFFINSLGVVQNARLRKSMNFSVRTKADFFAAFFSGILGLTLALIGFGVWSLVLQVLVNNFIFVAFLWLFSKWK